MYRFTPFRIDTLCGGALMAIIAKYKQHWLNRTILRVVLLLAIGTFAATKGYYTSPQVIRFGYTALLLASCSLLGLALYPQSLTARFFSTSFLRSWGKYSYAVYLFHYPITEHVGMNLASIRNHIPFVHSLNEAAFLMLPCELLLVFAMSALSWRFFEAPLLKAKKHFRYRPRPTHYLA